MKGSVCHLIEVWCRGIELCKAAGCGLDLERERERERERAREREREREKERERERVGFRGEGSPSGLGNLGGIAVRPSVFRTASQLFLVIVLWVCVPYLVPLA